jgi:hypothetical protein
MDTTLDMTKAIRVAHGSTRHNRPRWTEIAIYYFLEPPLGGKRWLAEIKGVSTVPGEMDRRQTLRAGTLERALKIVDESGDVGRAVAETAREWAEDNRLLIEAGAGKPFSAKTDEEALAWLYGEAGALSGRNSLPARLARDLGIGESTVRMQIKNGTDVKVPLRSILPFVDREAFRRFIAAQAGEPIDG